MQVLSYSIKGASAATGVSISTIWNLVKAGDLWTFKLGSRTLIEASVLEDYISRLAAKNRPTSA